METYDRDQSEFNDAANRIRRINALLATINQARIDLDAYLWYNTLNAFFAELSTEMKKDELKVADTIMDNGNNMIHQQNIINSKTGKNAIPYDLYKLLHRYEFFLRSIYEKSGIAGRRLDNPEFAVR